MSLTEDRSMYFPMFTCLRMEVSCVEAWDPLVSSARRRRAGLSFTGCPGLGVVRAASRSLPVAGCYELLVNPGLFLYALTSSASSVSRARGSPPAAREWDREHPAASSALGLLSSSALVNM